eukprot:3913704-Prymnesium_polylepis.3
MQRQLAVMCGDLAACTRVDERANALGVAALAGHVQGCGAVSLRALGRGARAQQQAHTLGVPRVTREQERRPSVCLLPIDCGTAIDEKARAIRLPEPRSHD